MSAIRRGSFMRSGVLEISSRSIPSQGFLNRDPPLTQASFSSSLGKRKSDRANLVSDMGKKGDLVHSLQLPNRWLTLKQKHRANKDSTHISSVGVLETRAMCQVDSLKPVGLKILISAHLALHGVLLLSTTDSSVARLNRCRSIA